MTNTTFIAESDLTIECDSGSVFYQKGQPIFIELDENDDPFISYHEEDKDGQVVAFEIDITTLDMFNSLMENVILVEAELDPKISYEEMELDTLLLDEGVDLEVLTCYIAEIARRKKRVVRKGKVATIKVPVRKRKKRATSKQRAARIKQVRKLARSPKAKRSRAKSMKIRGRRLASNDIVMHHLLVKETQQDVTNFTVESLLSYFGDNASVSQVSENQISVNYSKADEKDLIEALEAAEVYYTVESKEGSSLVTLNTLEAEPVVESYYLETDNSLDSEESELEDQEEAKMTDEAVMKAAEAMSKNSDDPKIKKFAQGLMDFYKKNDSFTPDQVSGLQNIMKNASFHMAKKDD